MYLEQLLEKKLQTIVEKKLAQPLPPPPPEPIGASTPTPTRKQMKGDVQELAEYTIHIMKALTKAHIRLTEHQQYPETRTPPKGMTCSLNINPFRPRDSQLAEHKKEYQRKILNSLVTHYAKVITTLENDQRVAGKREKTLRAKYPDDSI